MQRKRANTPLVPLIVSPGPDRNIAAMKRRSLIALLGASSLSVPARAQAPRKARVGILIGAASDANDYALEAFRLGLRDQGFTDDRNLTIERQIERDDSDESLARAAKALADWSPDVVLAANTPPVKAMRLAAPDVAIVMLAIGDPVGSGLVASLARPGRRTTGLSGLDAELTGKRLELLKEVAPGTTRVGLLANPDNPVFAVQLRNAEAAAKTRGIELLRQDVHRTSELDDAVAAIAKRGATALLRLSGFRSADALQRLGALTTQYRLPFCSDRLLEVRGGLLMSYGPNVAAEFRQAAGIVGKILRGADPATLPVESPQRFDLALNEATAKRLGLVFPAIVRARATTVIDF
jgi:putative ABC transport system substrate-binding protein